MTSVQPSQRFSCPRARARARARSPAFSSLALDSTPHTLPPYLEGRGASPLFPPSAPESGTGTGSGTRGTDLATLLGGKVVVVGIGNPDCGDDAAGCLVAERLLGAGCSGVINAEEVPENVVGPVMAERPDTVLLVDAVDLRTEPGSLAVLERTQLASYCPSTHRVPLELLMRYLEHTTGARVVLVGIQPQCVGFRLPMSVAVEAGATRLAALLTQLLGAEGRNARRPSC